MRTPIFGCRVYLAFIHFGVAISIVHEMQINFHVPGILLLFFCRMQITKSDFCFFFYFEWLILFFDWNRFVLSVQLLLEHGHFSKDLFVLDGPSD